jgi:hypothetical protein
MRRTKLYAAASVQIDPIDCDSTVSYRITGDNYFSATVQVADCNRKIDWYFRDHQSSVAKIDKAIETLQAFRAEFIAAQTLRKRLVKKKKK